MQRVVIGDLELAVTVEGSGPPLLLVHGFPLDHSMWQYQIESFRDEFRVIAPDLRGFGASQGGGEIFSMAQFADDLAALLDALQIDERVTFCGLSMGGYVAWQFWDRHPDRLARCVLCDTRAAADSAEARATRLETADQVLEAGTAQLTSAMIDKLFSLSTRELHPELLARTRHVMQGTAPGSVAAALRGMAARPDMTDRLGDLDRPVLLVCGSDDVITPPQEMAALATALPQAQFVAIEGAGHMSPLEQPQHVNAALRAFFEVQG